MTPIYDELEQAFLNSKRGRRCWWIRTDSSGEVEKCLVCGDVNFANWDW